MNSLLRLSLRVFIALLSWNLCLAQELRSTNVSGTVTDSLTGHPLENTNVYIASSSVGTSTDSLGRYRLLNVPPGDHKLVFSRVGYAAKVTPLYSDQSGEMLRDAQLQMHTIELGDIEITGAEQKEWLRHLDEFKPAFLGESWNASQCTIVNPEILSFRFDDSKNILFASTDRPLIVENKGLGYRLEVVIAEFRWNTKDGYGWFITYPYFRALASRSPGDTSTWRDSRRKTYLGSFQHFLRSLYNGKTLESGFALYGGRRAELEEGLGKYTFADPLGSPQQTAARGKVWSFENWIRVEYSGTTDRIASYVHLVEPQAIVEPSGTLSSPLAVEMLGHWSRSRMADMLPDDFDTR